MEVKRASTPVSLWFTGRVGGVFVLAALAVIFYGVPNLWDMGVSPWLKPALGKFVDGFMLLIAMVAVTVGLGLFGIAVAGPNPPHGIRGSIFLGISLMVSVFFVGRGLLLIVERMMVKFDVGHLFSLLFVGLLTYLLFRFVASTRMQRWSVGLEESGWFDTGSFKRTQGLRVRRFTVLGILLLLGSGVYTMVQSSVLPAGALQFDMPFTDSLLTLLPDARLTVPALLVALTLWFAWRVVNYPVFADFLIATEAEINKVSWTPRARLIQDTIVVLITVFIITLFLFLVDIFWGWFLSRDFIWVLPTSEETQKPANSRMLNKNEY